MPIEKEKLELDVWFVVAEDDENVFALPRPKWTEEANATRNHFDGVCFGTEEEALDFCYEYDYGGQLRWAPRNITFETDYLH
jgi:hypothetical protein